MAGMAMTNSSNTSPPATDSIITDSRESFRPLLDPLLDRLLSLSSSSILPLPTSSRALFSMTLGNGRSLNRAVPNTVWESQCRTEREVCVSVSVGDPIMCAAVSLTMPYHLNRHVDNTRDSALCSLWFCYLAWQQWLRRWGLFWGSQQFVSTRT